MLKLSVVLGVVGLVLVALSFMPVLATFEARTAAARSPVPDAAYGKQLFSAKGCATCHAHRATATSGGFSAEVGPNLTNYQPNPEFLRRWLRDPQAIKPNTQMPNLNLSDSEIKALVAFLSENK
jgi:mono/diheme cytochrome c family protein